MKIINWLLKIFCILYPFFLISFLLLMSSGIYALSGIIDDAPKVSDLALRVLNGILSIIAVLAVVMIIFAAIMYITSSGDEGRATAAKKALIGSIIGLAIAVTSLIIVNVITGLV